MSALATSPYIAWFGEQPCDCAHAVLAVRSLGELAALRPLPEGLVVDLPREAVSEVFDALAGPALRGLVVLLLTDGLDGELHARAVKHDVLCLPRTVGAVSRDEVISTALARARARQKPDAMLVAACRAAMSARFVARTLDEAEGLATLLSLFCTEPERRVGGFLELLINAIEHGNLEISGPEKRTLLAEGRWHTELLERLGQPRYRERFVRVTFERDAHGITFSIEDEGAGFDAGAVMERELGQNDTRHGRGIALARLMSFDELIYEGRGNRLVGRIR